MPGERGADEGDMYISPLSAFVAFASVTGAVLTLYIMRRRVRLGRRTPKF